MATMRVRDGRIPWPQAEKLLARDGEIVITRDAQPVARIVPYHARPRAAQRKRFDPDEHLAWLRRFWKGKPAQPSSDEILRRDRGE